MSGDGTYWCEDCERYLPRGTTVDGAHEHERAEHDGETTVWPAAAYDDPPHQYGRR
jgi:hypothetical protein